MSKARNVFQCQGCGHVSHKWLGRCPDCGAWNSFSEERQPPKSLRTSGGQERAAVLQSLDSIPSSGEERDAVGIREFDRVLGGGLVKGAVVLIGGDPGIGKSTLLLQAVSRIAAQRKKVLYVSGEESPVQIKLRADRLSVADPSIVLYPETVIERIIDVAREIKPRVIVIDSIQTVYTEELTSAPGSVSQIRESAAKLMVFAKKEEIPLFLIGHVTKEGAIAGPKVLEHIVDTVLYFEGDRGYSYRVIRAIKNRFGAANEIGIFEMTDRGLIEIDNPSQLFLSERPAGVSGSAVIASMEGTRPLLVEVQALVSPTTFGMPRRTSMGIDFNRVNLLIAVLEKRAGLHLGTMDVFVNIVGGLKIAEPAADLGVVASIVSSFRERIIDAATVVVGEVGLSGEVRAVAQAEARLREAAKIGFRRAVIPRGNAERLKDDLGLAVEGVHNVEDALERLSV